MTTFKLDNLRNILMRLEETIIFALIERAQFGKNLTIYDSNKLSIDGFPGCFSDYLLWETEKIHSKVRRYTSPDEYAFFDRLPAPILPSIKFDRFITRSEFNVNRQIGDVYKHEIIPEVCKDGDDGNYGSSATCDVACLQALSKRIHYGKFVAEVKFQQKTSVYTNLINLRDEVGIFEELTDRAVEQSLFDRVKYKASTYGRDLNIDDDNWTYKIAPETIVRIYEKWIIPLTKEVEVRYLMERLNNVGERS